MSFQLDIVFIVPEQLSEKSALWYKEYKQTFRSIFDQVKGDVQFSITELNSFDSTSLTNKIVLLFHFPEHKWSDITTVALLDQAVGFFNVAYESDDSIELDQFLSKGYSFLFSQFDIENHNFFPKVVDVCYGILDQIEGHRIHEINGGVSPVIFLADVKPDQEHIRDSLKRELISHGYIVYPNKPVSKVKEVLEKELAFYLQKAHLCIHIINEEYDEDNKGKVELENEYCKYYVMTQNSNLERFVWSPPLDEFDERQLVFIERLKRHSKALELAELIQTPLERFKNIIKNRIVKLMFERNIPQGYSSVLDSAKLKVYLINNVEDQEKAKKIVLPLNEAGIEVIPSFFDGDEVELLDLHRFFLASCDMALIYHSGRNQRWLQMKMLDLLKAPGYGRNRPIETKGILLEDASLKLPKIENLDDLIVLGKDDISVQGLKAFIENK